MLKIIHPYSPAMVNHIERWLCAKALQGWQLEDVRGWKFVFRKCKPYITRYCSYDSFGKERGLVYDYLTSKKLYCLSGSLSSLNRKNAIIYEADNKKIDLGFEQFIMQRNKYYLKHYLLFILYALVNTVAAIWLMQQSHIFSVLLFIGVVLLVYSVVSVVILIYEIRHRKVIGSLK